MPVNLNALSDVNTLNSYINLARTATTAEGDKEVNLVNPEVFYSKQLLDTIRLDASHYVYYRLADETPIQKKADKLVLRRWAPLQAHTVPLMEGVPPVTDRGSVEKYELEAKQYGRYMEFTDKVDFQVVDPVLAHYTKEYSLVAMETFDLLAKEALMLAANKYYAGGAKDFTELTVNSKPNMTDLRLIILSMKTSLVKPRSNGRYHVIGSPEFYYDMIDDEIVKQYMSYNNTTSTMYSNSKLCPMFDMEFYETMNVPTSGKFFGRDDINDTPTWKMMTYKYDAGAGSYTYTAKTEVTLNGGYVKDSRTGMDASYMPTPDAVHYSNNAAQEDWGLADDEYEFKAQHILIVGKDALVRTGLAGEGAVKVYVKEAGSAGVLDPINQRQSIGFKINSVGFGSVTPNAITDYICVPSQCLSV